ncbi:MAG TPA: translation initiation factor 2 [Chromatiales bacterium]|nr:translation initiation factor 2 [Chromatiales bacterium]
MSEAQFMRAARSFEAIVVSQIEVKRRLGTDIKNAIRVGMIVLGLIAVSILVLLLSVSSQINRITEVVKDMNSNFTLINEQMGHMSSSIDSMVKRVALLELIDQQTGTMDRELVNSTDDVAKMQPLLKGISDNVLLMRDSVTSLSSSVSVMDSEVQLMSQDMHRMAKPARTMQKMFPFP